MIVNVEEINRLSLISFEKTIVCLDNLISLLFLDQVNSTLESTIIDLFKAIHPLIELKVWKFASQNLKDFSQLDFWLIEQGTAQLI